MIPGIFPARTDKQPRPGQAVTYDPTLRTAFCQLARVRARFVETETSQRIFAAFNKLHQQEATDSQAADQARDEDTRKAS